jgi:mRNA-degrading endonuclease RelE of RelBE toxin-antitoxin system
MARLRLTEKADKEIDKLDRSVKGAMWDFMWKFRQDPANPGLRFKQLKGDSRLYSARVSDDYRALMLHVKDDEYMLVTVKHRSESYDNPERYAYQINQVTGGIDFYDMASLAGAVKPAASAGPPPLFARYSQTQLIELGVGRPLLSTIGKITTEEQLLEFTECVPRLTADVLLALHDGASVDGVMEQVTAPASAAEPVDPADYAAAVARPASLVTTDDETLQAILQGGFERWQVYLHPAQRRVVERSYSGPARVSGGPGTGKTIVALHRVKWLVQRLPPDSSGQDVLFTTFNKNLAVDLRQRLLQLGGPELLDRVDVVNIDRLATQVVSEAQPGTRPHWMDDSKAIDLWRAVMLELGETRWDAEFLHDEWSQVVLGHAITSRQEYFRARRAGRGRQLNRAQRAEIWKLVEQFTKRLDDQNLWTFRRVAAHAARLEQQLAAAREPRYRHIVVDEAQDLSSAHWMLLRAMGGRGPNDLFLILAGITDAAVPGQRAAADPARQQRELMRARSLLFVAATRARDELVISWNGQPSRFLPQQS